MAAFVERRFVVLRHEMPGGTDRRSHWDLMLEDGGVLRTWALDAWPPESDAEGDAPSTCGAESLPDHRPFYLDYEGPLSEGRGTVWRCERGTWRAIAITESRWEIELTGEGLAGRCVLERADQGWTFAFKKA